MAKPIRNDVSSEYVDLIAAYLDHNFADRQIDVRQQVDLGTSIIGKKRKLDILLIHKPTGKALGLECKVQLSAGTADEKIPYALRDVAAMRIPGCVVYAGAGFSPGVLHMLESAEEAAYCLPNPADLSRIRTRKRVELFSTWQLDHTLAVTFAWWDLIDSKPRAEQLPLGLGGAKQQRVWPALTEALKDWERKARRPPKRATDPGQGTPDSGQEEVA